MKNIFTLALLGLITLSSLAHNEKESFEFAENKGQWPSNVLYHAKLLQGGLFFEKDRFTFDLFSATELNELYKKKHDLTSPFEGNSENPLIRERIHAPSGEGLQKHAYSMIFKDGNLNPIVIPNLLQTRRLNYYIGNDESKWASDVKLYRELSYKNVWEGIDVDIYSTVSNLKYDYRVAPFANTGNIQIDYQGVNGLRIDEKGTLHVILSHGEVKELHPVAFQYINGRQTTVPCEFVVNGTTVSFKFPQSYDQSKELIIDPVLIFAGLSGSTADNWGFTATYDALGNLYAAGICFGAGYPATAGSYSTTFKGGSFDIAISKFTPDGSAEVYATYLGGTLDNELPTSLVCDASNNLVLLGTTGSSDYPTTAGAYDQTFNGGWPATYANMWGSQFAAGTDIVLTKLNGLGALLYSTFIGGSNDNDGLNESLVYNYSDQARGEVVLDVNGNIYVCTSAWSTNFPGVIVANSGSQDAIIFKMSSDLSTLNWSTYYGGSGNDTGYSIRLNSSGDVYICGGTTSSNLNKVAGGLLTTYQGSWDGYLAKFNGTSGALQYDTYIGTTSYDQTFIIDIDASDDVYMVGQTLGSYSVVNAAFSNANSAQFIHKISPDLTTTIYSTKFGNGSLIFNPPSTRKINISPTAFMVDDCGNVYVSGWGGGFNGAGGGPAYNPQAAGNVTGMPVTADALQATTDGKDFYFFVLERDATSQLYGSFFGDATTPEHTDGGTSRFDPKGIVYQSVCAACNTGLFPNTPGVAHPTSGTAGNAYECNLGVIKFEMNFAQVQGNAYAPADTTLCSADYTINFSAGPTPPPQNFWDFGDGVGTSTAANPSYTYGDTGIYNVMYIAIDSSTCNIRDTSYFVVDMKQAPQFSASFNIPTPEPCTSPDSMMVQLSYTGSGVDSIVWNMGDGTIYYDSMSVTHYYMSQGSFPILGIAYQDICNFSDTIRDTANFVFTSSTVNATAPPDTTLCAAPFNVNFSATSPVPNHYWDLGDGSDTTDAIFTHTYADTGTYNVMYIAIDSSTCNIADTATFVVQVNQTAQFSATFNLPTPDPCTDPDSMMVQLTYTGTGVDSIVWNMGDGTIYYDSMSVTHYYTTQGSYPISGIAYQLLCNYTDTIRDTAIFIITNSQVNAIVPPNVSLCAAPYNVDFTATSAVPDHFWDLGDGNTSTTPTFTHTYADTGTYNVMYVAIDSSTCNVADTATFVVQVEQYATFSAVFNIPTPDPCTSPDSMMVQLTYTGTGVDSIVWDMGDGKIYNDSLASVTHYYMAQGTYPIMGIAYDLDCNFSDTIRDTAIFIITNSQVDAIAPPNVMLCAAPYNVDFTATSAVPDHFWDLGDGNTSTTPTFTHTYADTGTYNVMYVAIDSSTCNIADTATFVVQVNKKAVFSAVFNIPTIDPCVALDSIAVTLTYTGSGVDSIYWDMGDGYDTGDSLASLTHYYTNTGIYYITGIAYDLLCNYTDTIRDTVVYIQNATTVTAPPAQDLTLCNPPYDVIFNAPEYAPNYYWDFGDGSPASTDSANIHTYATTGTYTVTYAQIDSSTCNIGDTSTFTVTVNQAAVFSASFNIPTPDPCEFIDSMMVQLTYTGSGVDQIIWDMGDGTIYMDSLASLTHYYTSEGTYPIQGIAYDFLCNYTDTIRDTANFIITSTNVTPVPPVDIELCAQPYDVVFEATGSYPNVYWDFGDGNNSTSDTLIHTYMSADTFTAYFVAIDSSTCNIADTSYFTVIINQAPVFTAAFDIPIPAPCEFLDSMLVQLTYTGSGVDSIVWDMGDGNIYSDSLASLSHYYTLEGTYYITGIAYDLGCNYTDTIRDTVVFITTYSFVDPVPPVDLELCAQPYDVLFEATGSYPNVYWDFGDGTTSTNDTTVHTYAAVGSYVAMFVAIDSSTCNIADTSFFDVDIAQAETFNAVFDFPTPDPCDTTGMTVDLAFTGTGADSIVWVMGDGFTYTDQFNITHTYAATGTYLVQMFAWDLQCNYRDSIDTVFSYYYDYTETQVMPQLDLELCTTPYTVDFTASGVAPQYYWNFGDGNTSTATNPSHTYANTGVYTVLYAQIDPSTCNIGDTTSFTVTVSQAELLSMNFDIPPLDPCTDTTQLIVDIQFTGTGADILTIDMGDGSAPYNNQFSISHAYNTQGTYLITCYASDTVCMADSTFTQLVEYYITYSEAVADVPEDVELCGAPYIVDLASTSNVPYQMWFIYNAGNPTPYDSTDLDSVAYEFPGPGNYVVTYIAIDSNSCNFADTVSFNVDITKAPEFSADINFVPPPPCEGDSMIVNLVFSGEAAQYFQWDMGDGTIYNTDTVQHVYYNAGIYPMTLTATDTVCNKTATISEDIIFYGNINTETIIPNIFTPDEDGKNDVLTFINLNGTSDFYITIWNRWGRKVFESDDPTAPWDGNNKYGTPCDAGVYYYELQYVNMCDTEIHITPGFVHLVRGNQ